MKKLIKVLTEKENLLIAEIGAKLRFDIIVNYTINGIERNRLCKCLMEDAVTKDWLVLIDVDEDEHIDKVKIYIVQWQLKNFRQHMKIVLNFI